MTEMNFTLKSLDLTYSLNLRKQSVLTEAIHYIETLLY